MGVFTQASVIADHPEPGSNGDDGDLPSLVERVRAGRPAAVDRLVSRVQDRVRGWAARFSDDADTADDVAQDVLIDLERRVKKFEGASRFTTWLFTVTRNVALSRRRREQRRAALLDGRDAAAEERADTTVNLDAVLLANLVLRYVDALPKKQRLIFELADLRGLPPAEIARTLGMEQVTVRAHLFKARRAIRAKMFEHHERLLTEYIT